MMLVMIFIKIVTIILMIIAEEQGARQAVDRSHRERSREDIRNHSFNGDRADVCRDCPYAGRDERHILQGWSCHS